MSLLRPIIGAKPVKLKDIDPADHGKLTREEADALTAKMELEMEELQELLYAAQETPVLIVLQGLDTAGKDGTIQHVMGHMNPQSCHVASFKVPTPLESSHDFLWRIHAATPGRGTLTIFNRSHYEDVLVVRVHKIIDAEECKHRYELIRNFEELLLNTDTLILKFFLHITKDEQEQRLLDREKDPSKAWKLSPADWKERELWDDYQAAYEDAINHTTTADAPWYVVPANHKWYRNAAIAEAIVEALRPKKAQWQKRLQEIGAQELKDLRAMRQTH